MYGDGYAATSNGDCKACEAGRFNLDAGQGGRASCKLCTPGRTSSIQKRTTICDPCSVGSYLEDEGSSEQCKSCKYYNKSKIKKE